MPPLTADVQKVIYAARVRTTGGREDIVPLAAFVLLPAELTLCLHLLDAPLGFAGAP